MSDVSRAPTRLVGSVVRLVAEVAVAGPVVVLDAARYVRGQADAFARTEALGNQINDDTYIALYANYVLFNFGLSLLALVPAVRAGNDPQEPWADLWGNRSPNPNA